LTLRKRAAQLALLALTAALLLPAPAGAADDPAPSLLPAEDDYSAIVLAPPLATEGGMTSVVLDSDPLGLVPKASFVQRYSLDTDHWEVWMCGNTGLSHSEAIAKLEVETVPYFDDISGGLHHLEFVAGGTVSAGDCVAKVKAASSSGAEGALIFDTVTGGGYATPGYICYGDTACDWIPSTFPGNGRYAVVGAGSFRSYPMVIAHELGHTLQWPHSNSGIGGAYDNPIDLMSGNLAVAGWTYPDPYGTLAYNRYQSGWFDAADVVVSTGAFSEVTLQPYDAAGTKMLVIPTDIPGRFYTLGTRVSSAADPIPQEWNGVEVYLVDHDCGIIGFGDVCPGIFRTHTTVPANPYSVDHVLQVGESADVNGVSVAVTGRDGDGFTVMVGGDGLPFGDIISSQFTDDVVWLADSGITSGCNPPANTEYCPDANVTRGQMAAFLARALGLTDTGTVDFTDDDESVFETDIAKLATAGITLGCNPPANTMYCPDAVVTRGQMAAFLHRADAFLG